MSILFILFVTIKAQNNDYSCQNSGNYEEELMRIGEMQMFNREYNEAICTFEEVVAESKRNCFAMMYLSELYLVKGLESVDVTDAIKNYDKSITYTDKLIDIYAEDLNSAFLQSLALIYKANTYSIDKKQEMYKKALNVINIGLSDNCNHPDLWFAYGEWWFYLAEMPLEESKLILEAVNADLYMVLPKNNRLLYDFALDAYANTLNQQRHSIFGLYGFIKTSVKLNYHQKVDFYNEQIVSFDNFYPLNHYYLGATRQIVSDFKQQKGKIQAVDFLFIPNF